MSGTTFFVRFNSVSESFDSAQLMTHNDFINIDSNSAHDSKWIYEIWFRSTHDSIASKIF